MKIKLYAFAGLDLVIAVDLISFMVAFVALAAFIKVPDTPRTEDESTLKLAREGLKFLKETPLVFTLILLMSGVNLVASAFDATLPGYVIPNPKGGSNVLGIITSVEIVSDTTKLQTALKGVNTEIRNTQSQLHDVDKLLKLDPGSTELLAQKHRLP